MFKTALKRLRKERNLTQPELAILLNVSQSAVGNWETGNRIPDVNMLITIAEFFGVSVDHLLGKVETTDTNLRPLNAPLTAGAVIPVLGKVPAGVPIEAIEDIIDEIELSAKQTTDGYEYFALLVSGNSMYPEYMDGDIVVVRRQETAETGDDVIAYVNGYDATLKRLVRSQRGITLRPLNPEFEPHTYTNEEVRNLPIRIAGIVVEQRRNRK